MTWSSGFLEAFLQHFLFLEVTSSPSGESESALSHDEEETLEEEGMCFVFPFFSLWLCFTLCCCPGEQDSLPEDLLVRLGVGGAGLVVPELQEPLLLTSQSAIKHLHNSQLQ